MNTQLLKKDNHQKEKNPLSAGLGLAVAMALGATLGVLFAPKEGTETQKDILEKAEQLAKKFHKSREDVQKTVEKVFGEVSEELEKNYLELQGDILARVDDLKDQAELTQKKYDEIVNETVKHFSKGRKWSHKIIKNLQENFAESWKEFKSSLTENPENKK